MVQPYPSPYRDATVDMEVGAGSKARFIRGQKNRHTRHVLRRASATDWMQRNKLCSSLRVIKERLGEWSLDGPRNDAVDPDPVRRVVGGHDACQGHDASFGG